MGISSVQGDTTTSRDNDVFHSHLISKLSVVPKNSLCYSYFNKVVKPHNRPSAILAKDIYKSYVNFVEVLVVA